MEAFTAENSILEAAVPLVIWKVCVVVEAGGVRLLPICTNVVPSAACNTCIGPVSLPYFRRSKDTVAMPPLADKSTVGVTM